jgi:5-methylcytosine-specific restriction protein A
MGKLTTLKPRIATVNVLRGSSVATKRIAGWELQQTRKRIGERDEYTCQRCGALTIQGEVDHATPLYLGGAESDENRQWLCRECHRVKSDEEEGERRG